MASGRPPHQSLTIIPEFLAHFWTSATIPNAETLDQGFWIFQTWCATSMTDGAVAKISNYLILATILFSYSIQNTPGHDSAWNIFDDYRGTSWVPALPPVHQKVGITSPPLQSHFWRHIWYSSIFDHSQQVFSLPWSILEPHLPSFKATPDFRSHPSNVHCLDPN